MIHAFRLGPVQAGRNDAFFVFGGIDDRGEIVQPEVAHSDAAGFAALANRFAGQPLRCEPGLAAAAGPFGFEPADLPEEAFHPRATLAFGLALGPGAGRPSLEVLTRFLEACSEFWAAKPWELVGSDEAVRVELSVGGRRRVAEASVMGAGREEFGVALYDEPGSIRAVADAVIRGRMEAASRVAATAVTFDAEPAWAVGALDDAFALPRLPVPLRIRKGKPAPATGEELHVLAAVLEALVALTLDSEGLEPAEFTVEAAGRAVTARVSLPDEPVNEADLAEPMLVPEPVAAASRGEKTPRNAPCPCGSGRKYKKCHLAEDEERERAASGTGPGAEEARAHAQRLAERDPVHALDERITADALALARKRWGRAFDPEGVFRAMGLDFATSQAVLGWCSDHHRGPDGRTALDLYIEERGGALDDAGRGLVAAQRKAWFSYHEVVAADPGESLTLRDLLAGGERVVQERTASRTLRARDVLLARVVDLGDRAILAGCHLRSLPRREGDLARQFARKALRVRAKTVSPAKLREATADGTLFAGWQQLVRAIDTRPPPRLQNTDAEDLLLSVDRFEVVKGKANEVAARLLEFPGARRDDGGGATIEISFVREGNAMGVLPTTLVGRAVVEGSVLRLETNSVPRANALRVLVQDRLGPLVSFRLREHADPVAQLGGGLGLAHAAEEAPMPAEVLEVVRKMQAEHYRRWLDEAIPALGGLTPRDAAKRKGAPRKALLLLLAEIEHAEAGQPAARRFDVGAMRRDLGLD
jgi:hypothetical protein